MSAMVIGRAVRSGGPAMPVVVRPARARRTSSQPALHLTRRGRAVLVGLALVLVAFAVALGARAAVAAGDGDVRIDRHVVQPGETMWSIAESSRGAGESVQDQVRELVRVNGLSGAHLTAGQELVVPRG